MTSIRAEVRRWLNDVSASPDIVRKVVLAVTEAVANSIEHAYCIVTEHSTIGITFWTEDNVIFIEINDHGRWRPPAANHGQIRGLANMRRQVESVMIRFGSAGTNVLLRQPVSLSDPSGAAPACGAACAEERSSR